MRYWILVVLLNGLFALVIHFAAPELFGSTEHYVGAGICALIAIVITWRDPPGMLDNVLLFLFKGAPQKTESMVTPVFATPILTTSWLA